MYYSLIFFTPGYSQYLSLRSEHWAIYTDEAFKLILKYFAEKGGHIKSIQVKLVKHKFSDL